MKISLDIKVTPENQNIDELIVTDALLGVLSDRIRDNGHDLPEVIKQSQDEVNRELNYRLESDRRRQLEILTSKRARLATTEEKRARLDEEIETLTKKLAGKSAAAASGATE